MTEIRDKNHLRPGDILRVTVTTTCPDSWMEGPIVEGPSSTLYLSGMATLRFSDGEWNDSYVIDLGKYPAKREPKPLPTEEGAFIFVDAVTPDVDQWARDEDEDEKFKPTWAYLDECGDWSAPDWDLRPEQITAWRPAALSEVTA